MSTRNLMRLCRHLVVAMFVSGALLGAAQAETVPAAGVTDARVRTVTYDPDEIYRLYGFVGYSIELVFEPGEVFEGHGGGDLEGITFGAHQHQLIVKPRAANVGTNFVVYTDRRAYRFHYTVSRGAPDAHGAQAMYVVRFVYPPSPEEGDPARRRIDQALASARNERAQNRDYWYRGPASLKPLAAFDDGVHTRLTFGAKSEWPAVFVRNEDGSESLLNFSIEQGDLIIHRVARSFILRRGRLAACIVNQAFEGQAERLSSGTLAPSVVRESKGERP
ncbi:TrbG/VirB9 family P-type conjugative transfer protein [Steroidobacter sp. S1-65]|uniref:TrbG/VirB9 family P-type conjugative transfer protein n=1 Tax=Steroidobacter gossypii TaxID=2805490 RepID=A0ABS1WXS7_9GAMM|nr:TrbG/VirB9 family P-type conjugative transfer protein [Steroidobacter gossypii]MBM0105790.1 TrbG/VirB9 family P-type conjugative transfer protein [Steroidobacter gossypii]